MGTKKSTPRGRRPTAKRARDRKSAMLRAKKMLDQDAIPRRTLGTILRGLILRFGMSREVAGAVVDDAASQMSRLMHRHDEEFSAERMAKMLVRLGASIDVTVRLPKSYKGKRGRVSMIAVDA